MGGWAGPKMGEEKEKCSLPIGRYLFGVKEGGTRKEDSAYLCSPVAKEEKKRSRTGDLSKEDGKRRKKKSGPQRDTSAQRPQGGEGGGREESAAFI